MNKEEERKEGRQAGGRKERRDGEKHSLFVPECKETQYQDIYMYVHAHTRRLGTYAFP